MAKLEDVAEADSLVESVLTEMYGAEVDDDVYLHTKAVCYSIRALGVRLDYVATTFFNRLFAVGKF